MVNKIGPYSVTCILCYEWSTQPTCIPNGQNNLNLYSVFPQWSTSPARIPNGRWSLGLAVRRWWSSHVCRYSHRSSILRGQRTWCRQHETHIGYWTEINPFLLSTEINGLRSRSIEPFLEKREKIATNALRCRSQLESSLSILIAIQIPHCWCRIPSPIDFTNSDISTSWHRHTTRIVRT